jgi:hypothetical protein
MRTNPEPNDEVCLFVQTYNTIAATDGAEKTDSLS